MSYSIQNKLSYIFCRILVVAHYNYIIIVCFLLTVFLYQILRPVFKRSVWQKMGESLLRVEHNTTEHKRRALASNDLLCTSFIYFLNNRCSLHFTVGYEYLLSLFATFQMLFILSTYELKPMIFK